MRFALGGLPVSRTATETAGAGRRDGSRAGPGGPSSRLAGHIRKTLRGWIWREGISHPPPRLCHGTLIAGGMAIDRALESGDRGAARDETGRPAGCLFPRSTDGPRCFLLDLMGPETVPATSGTTGRSRRPGTQGQGRSLDTVRPTSPRFTARWAGAGRRRIVAAPATRRQPKRRAGARVPAFPASCGAAGDRARPSAALSPRRLSLACGPRRPVRDARPRRPFRSRPRRDRRAGMKATARALAGCLTSPGAGGDGATRSRPCPPARAARTARGPQRGGGAGAALPGRRRKWRTLGRRRAAATATSPPSSCAVRPGAGRAAADGADGRCHRCRRRRARQPGAGIIDEPAIRTASSSTASGRSCLGGGWFSTRPIRP